MNPAKLPPPEHRVLGADIALPLLEGVSAIRSHSASRSTWHQHARFELLILRDGATAYKFPQGSLGGPAGWTFPRGPAGHDAPRRA